MLLQKFYISHFVRDDIQSFRLSGGGWLAALPPTNPHPPKFNVIYCHSERSEEYNNFYRTPMVFNHKAVHLHLVILKTEQKKEHT